MMVRLSHVTDSTLHNLMLLSEAERDLLEYRPPNAVLSHQEKLKLAQLIGRGVGPSLAAERV